MLMAVSVNVIVESEDKMNNTDHKKILASVYLVTYREEFCTAVRANSESEAIEKAMASDHWEICSQTGDLWQEYLEVQTQDEYENETANPFPQIKN